MLRLLLALVLAATTLDAAPRRRAVRQQGGPSPLRSVELVADSSDLKPLGSLIGSATVVALGDATHGTHEFFTVKHRMIDYLVRHHEFDVLSLEAPFPITERINQYVQGGPGDARALLAELRTRLFYLFWDVDELLTVIEWVRVYNLHRGDAPPIEIAGADIYDYEAAVAGVLAYLRGVDPAAATTAESNYACVLAGDDGDGCATFAGRVRDALAAMPTQSRAYEDALHLTSIVMQSFHSQRFEPRDQSMAENLLWIREHRGRSGKVIHWGHQEHVGKLPSIFVAGRTMGTFLAERLGADYVAIGTLTGSGSFLQWERLSTGSFTVNVLTFPDPETGSYELQFRRLDHFAVLIPLRGSTATGTFRTGGTSGGWRTLTQSLPAKLDAVIYIDRTTPTRPL